MPSPFLRLRSRLCSRLRPYAASFALLVLGAGVSVLTSCGGGGSSTGSAVVDPPQVELRGSVRLQTQLPAQLLPSGLGVAHTEVPQRGDDESAEPNDWLPQASELGRVPGGAPRAGSIGPGDASDLWCFGPVQLPEGAPQHVSFYVDFDAASGGTLVASLVRAGQARRALELRGDGTLDLELENGDQVLLQVRAAQPTAYGIGTRVDAAPRALLAAERELSALAREAQFAEAIGLGRVDVALGEIVVEREAGADPSALRALGLERLRAGGDVELWRHPGLARQTASAASYWEQAELVRRIARELPGWAHASPNIRIPSTALAGLGAAQTPNDPGYVREQWNLPLAGFDRAWDEVRGDAKLRIAFIDTGILADHPDLAARVSPLGYDFISDPKVAMDGDGIDPDPSEPRALGPITLFHGTYVSGVACAVTDNATGMAGATWQGELIMLRIFGPSVASSYDLVQAYRYCAGLSNASGRVLGPDERPHVLNMSYASFTITPAEIAAIEDCAKAGVWLFAAVGNDGATDKITYPGALPDVVGIGAVGPDKVKTSYSNVGDFVELVAPGGTTISGPGGVYSTWGGEFSPGKFTFVYNTFFGTSVATPHVAAAAALMRVVQPGLDFKTGRALLASTAEDLGDPGRDKLYGEGLLQVHAAIAAATQSAHRIHVLPAPLDFGETNVQLVADVTSAGLFPLENLSVGAISAPAGAISAQLDSMQAPTKLRLSLDRDAVRVGRYDETLELRDLYVRRELPLRFTKPIPAPKAPILVRLSQEGTPKYQTQCDAQGAFVLPGVALGSYVLEIGVDQNGDAQLGGSQEWYLRQDFVVGEGGTPVPNGTLIPWVD